MKKIILSIAIALGGICGVAAQGISYKTDAAIGFSKASFSFGDTSADTKTIVGYRISGGVEIPIGHSIYVNPSIALHSKGFKLAEENTKLHAHFIEIPVHVGYRVAISDLFSVAIQAGPYLSCGIKGELSRQKGNEKITLDIYKKGDSTDVSFKRFDMGVGAAAMVEYSRYYLLLGVDFGLLNTFNDKSTTVKNNSFHVGLGVRF